jgi:predicted pyridoxine 5'-phosphate oxidase superfamily flavin-nucleotide-binding protein
MKAIDALDDGCEAVLARAPVAGFGYLGADGLPHTTVVGGSAGFTRIESPTRIELHLGVSEEPPAPAGGVSLVYLLPGVGETLRITGTVRAVCTTGLMIEVQEAFTHCAKCVLRSQLWRDPSGERRSISAPRVDRPDTGGPLTDPAIRAFLAESPFVFVSSWDGSGDSDTSPKGDAAGFVQILDPDTLAIPDRGGNRRTDTFHNVIECDSVSIAALVPGRDDVLHLHGHAHVTDDPVLLQNMALGDKPPKAALVVHVGAGRISENDAIRSSRLWEQSSHVDRSTVPDLMQLGAEHLSRNRAHGLKATLARTLTRGIAASPKLLRRGVDFGYRKDLKDEGYR